MTGARPTKIKRKEGKMFEPLKRELESHGIKQHKVAEILDCTIRTANNKLNGRSEFTVKEAILIKEALNSKKPIEQLFKE